MKLVLNCVLLHLSKVIIKNCISTLFYCDLNYLVYIKTYVFVKRVKKNKKEYFAKEGFYNKVGQETGNYIGKVKTIG
jgi:predicted AAA+ superfamily ATPase